MKAPATTASVTLADIALALSVHKTSVMRRADKESWAYSEVAVRGGKQRLYPVASLPAAIRNALLARHVESMTAPAIPAIADTSAVPGRATVSLTYCTDLTDQQRLERDARHGVLAAIGKLQAETNCSKEAAMTTLLTNARANKLEPTLNNMLRLAKDARGRKGDDYPSIRTLKRWLSAPDLTPKLPAADMSIPDWANSFLGFYQTPQKPSVDAAYREYCKVTPAEQRPSVHQIRRFLAKLGTVTRERGRMGERELKNIMPFVRRDFSLLLPNDVWTADGHTFDAEVQHPFHGRPFRPEITTILDVATRRAVGWSVDLAESGLAVVDALRNAVEREGILAMFYVDNGPGYSNAMLKDETTGLAGRLGFTITHSLPYNSQARGVIERSHQTIWVNAAKLLPSYIGATMDREARLQQFKVTRSALKHGGAMPLMPWDLFVRFVEERIAEYNARAHRSLKSISPDQCLLSHVAKGFVAERLAEGELETLFHPRVARTVRRGEIEIFSNIYFSRALTEFHGLKAQVAYDIHNPNRVWVYTPEGRFICEADVNGNRAHYMPVSAVDASRAKRAKGRLKRNDAKRAEILEEMHGSPALPAVGASQIVLGGRVIDCTPTEKQLEIPAAKTEVSIVGKPPTPDETLAAPPPKRRTARTPAENYAEWLDLKARQDNGETLERVDAKFIESWPGSGQGRAYLKLLGIEAAR